MLYTTQDEVNTWLAANTPKVGSEKTPASRAGFANGQEEQLKTLIEAVLKLRAGKTEVIQAQIDAITALIK